ncbi:transcriptional regulator [Streptomyces toyocaensis]|uniref:Transcriptional regulator n=1 Tax=Streptomyces toyocaensis TaxID=55952 RepID=A0A081Y055_STRTO|nr:MerR family transcriptional regulator [Streptomyces toyocaensis]KES09178.1 transcriptional regulator [Streptomyces toyocaensis]
MRISELSRRSGVPNATIKYYLREGLLPPGRATAATQAEYDETHLRRLRLIRALVGVRGLSVASAKQVLEAMTEHRTDPHEVLGIAFGIRPSGSGDPGAAEDDGTDGTNPEAAALVEAMGWSVSEHNPARQIIDRTLRTLRSLDVAYDWQALLPYAELAERTARYDLDRIESITDPLEKAERAVLLTFLLEPALMALRRLAQENESTARHGGRAHP